MQQRRPIWVSVILAFYLLFSGGGLLLLGQVLSDFGALSTDLQKRFGHIELYDIVWIVGIQLLPLTGAATLADAVAAHGLPGTLLALGVGASVCHYAWQLRKRGSLV